MLVRVVGIQRQTCSKFVPAGSAVESKIKYDNLFFHFIVDYINIAMHSSRRG